jgi:O-antigen/teichoic acid export membrane protein
LSHSSIRQFVGPVTAADPARLASRFQSTLLVSIIQGLVIACIGIFGSCFVAKVWEIPAELKPLFVQLFSAQSVLIGLSFPFRPFCSILLAAQKFAQNYVMHSLFIVISIFLGWFGFQEGWGIWGLFWGNVLVGVGQFFFAVFGVARMNFLAPLFSRWQIQRADFGLITRDSLSFASGPLFGTLTGLLQSTVLSRLFGLEGVALWNVGAKVTMILTQVLSKLFESSFSGLSELIETGRRDLMLSRFGQLLGWALTICGGLALLIQLLNGPFITIWTGGKVIWPAWGNWWVGLMLFVAIGHLALAEAMKILVLWRGIRTTPAFDFLCFASGMGIACVTSSFSAFVGAAVLGPYLIGILINAQVFRKFTGQGIWTLVPERFRMAAATLAFVYLLLGLSLLFSRFLPINF